MCLKKPKALFAFQHIFNKRWHGYVLALTHCYSLLSLTCDVPQLQPDRLGVPVQNFEREVHPDGRSVVSGVRLMHIAFDDAGLPYSQITDDKNFVQMLFPIAMHR